MESPVWQDKFSFDDKRSRGNGKISPRIRVNLFWKNITPGQSEPGASSEFILGHPGPERGPGVSNFGGKQGDRREGHDEWLYWGKGNDHSPSADKKKVILRRTAYSGFQKRHPYGQKHLELNPAAKK
jgi:hypothetical protein